MASPDWRPLRGVDRKRLTEARLNAHYGAQWLARAARAYIPPRPDDSHTNFGWDDGFDGFTSHPLPDASRLGLRIGDLTLAILPPTGDPIVLPLNRRTEADIRTWLGRQATAKGLDAKALDAPPPYEMPAFAIATGGCYSVDAEALRELADWYADANMMLGKLRQDLAARNLNAPPVRCWPHHFDLDALIFLGSKEPDPVRAMGIGFSPGDEYYGEPYFYVSLDPAPDAIKHAPLPANGHWHTHEFIAAIATASRIIAARDQEAETAAFLSAAADIGIKALG